MAGTQFIRFKTFFLEKLQPMLWIKRTLQSGWKRERERESEFVNNITNYISIEANKIENSDLSMLRVFFPMLYQNTGHSRLGLWYSENCTSFSLVH
jgi:hypothetical protein